MFQCQPWVAGAFICRVTSSVKGHINMSLDFFSLIGHMSLICSCVCVCVHFCTKCMILQFWKFCYSCSPFHQKACVSINANVKIMIILNRFLLRYAVSYAVIWEHAQPWNHTLTSSKSSWQSEEPSELIALHPMNDIWILSSSVCLCLPCSLALPQCDSPILDWPYRLQRSGHH